MNLKRISIIFKMAALVVAPIAYIVKTCAMESHSPAGKLALLKLEEFSAQSEQQLAVAINQTTEMVYQIRDTVSADTLGNAISSDPIWLILSVALAFIALVIDFIATYRTQS